MFSKLMKLPLLNIADYEKTDLILFIHCHLYLYSIIVKYMTLKEACYRYQQSQMAYRKRYSLADRKSNYK